MKNSVIAGLIALVVSVGIGFTFFQGDKTTVVNEFPTERVENLGAASGPDLPFKYLGIGGVRTYTQYSDSLTQATSSVICSLQAPSATSSLETGSLRLDTSTTTAFSLQISNSLKPYTAGTMIATTSKAANSQVDMLATPTLLSTTTVANRIFKPNSYLVFKMLSSKAGTFSPTGTCQASWQTLN